MFLRMAACVVVGLVLVGCGGDRPVAFGTTGKPLLERLKSEVDQKSTKQVDQIQSKAKEFHEKKALRSDEFAAIDRACEYAKKGEWESAQKLIDGCLAETNRGSDSQKK